MFSLYEEQGDPFEGKKSETPEQLEVRKRMCAVGAEDKVPCDVQ